MLISILKPKITGMQSKKTYEKHKKEQPTEKQKNTEYQNIC